MTHIANTNEVSIADAGMEYLEENMIKVIFRVDERDGGYEVIAVFPEMAGDMNPYTTCAGYVHLGQHTILSTDIMEWTRHARPEEYKDLLAELVSIGYDNLKIRRKFSRQDLLRRKEQTKGE